MSYHRFIPGPDLFPYRLFDLVARECSNSDIICDVGCGLGHSTCYMTEALVAYDKRPKFYAFDLWGINDEEPFPDRTYWGEPFAAWLARIGGPAGLLDQFLFYLKNNPSRDRLTDWAQFPSHTICDNFEDRSVAFTFLNASVKHELVTRELKGWWPKIKTGGRLAVYGASNESVSNAVRLFGPEPEGTLDLAEGDTYVLCKS